MIRSCLEFLLSRALDSRKLPAAWLQRRVDRDTQLKQFNTEIRQLDSLLRSSAARRRGCMATEALATDDIANDHVANDGFANDHVANDHVANETIATENVAAETMTVDSRSADLSASKSSAARLTLPPTRTESLTASDTNIDIDIDINIDTDTDADADTDTDTEAKRSGQSVAWLAGLAIAALLFLALTPNWFRPSTPTVHAGEFSQQLTYVPGEVLRLINRAAETSQTQLPQLSPLPTLKLANLTLPTLARAGWDDVAVRTGSPMLQEPLQREIDIWQANWQILKSRLSATTQEL